MASSAQIFSKDVMLGNEGGRDLPSPSQADNLQSALSPNTQNRIINEIGMQNICQLDFDTELDFDQIDGGNAFEEENPYAREVAQMQNRSPSLPESPIDVTADCPDPIHEKKPYKMEIADDDDGLSEYFYPNSPMRSIKRSYTPYEKRPIEMTAKPRGRPPKQVADTKRAQLAKNWRLRKQAEEDQKTQRLAMLENKAADDEMTIAILTQENNELKMALNNAKNKSDPYERSYILKKEEENKKLRQENAKLAERYESLFAEFQDLKGIIQGVMWNQNPLP